MIEMKHVVKKGRFRFAFKRPGGGLQWKETKGSSDDIRTLGRLRTQIIQLIARQAACLCCSFLLADAKVEEALIAATDRGVRVYLPSRNETQNE